MKLAAILVALLASMSLAWAALTVGKMPRDRGVAVSFQAPPAPVMNWVVCSAPSCPLDLRDGQLHLFTK
jgi:hypothetical protein